MKKIVKTFCVYSFLLLSLLSFAQKIDNMAALRDMKSDKYIRLIYDNDFFGGTDYYYTQGSNLEFVCPKLDKNPLNKVLPKLNFSDQKYGLAIEHLGFTPTVLQFEAILYGDRPYSALLLIKSFLISTDTIQKAKLGSAFSIGIIGNIVSGKVIQCNVHKWIGNGIPTGWQNQIRNDLLINYQITHEKQLYRLNDLIALNSIAKINLGTFNTNVTGGFTAMLGKINSPFTSIKNKKGYQFYTYYQCYASAIAYDATLQGGVFNRSSPYIIHDADITRITLQSNFGVVIQYKKLFLEYSRTELTKEFTTGEHHSWGGFRVGLKL